MNQDKQFLALERNKNEFEVIGEAVKVDSNAERVEATFGFHPQSQTERDLKDAHARRTPIVLWLLEPTFEEGQWTGGFREVERAEGYVTQYGIYGDNGREMQQTIIVTKIQR